MFTYGIDVSIWQSEKGQSGIDWQKAFDQGIRFVTIKATQSNWNDVSFLSHLRGAQSVGMICGAYHYMTWDISAIIQARTFINAISGTGINFAVLDYEKDNRSENPPRPQPGASICASMARGWLSYVSDFMGTFPLIYTRKSFWQEFGTKADWINVHDLYVAWYPEPEYSEFAPSASETIRMKRTWMPAPFTDWKIWQFTEKGDGLKYGLKKGGRLDLDVFNGSVSDMRRYFGVDGSQGVEIPDNALQLLWDDYLARGGKP